MGLSHKSSAGRQSATVAVKSSRKARLQQRREPVRRFAARPPGSPARSNHPNIVRVYDSDHNRQTSILVREYVRRRHARRFASSMARSHNPAGDSNFSPVASLSPHARTSAGPSRPQAIESCRASDRTQCRRHGPVVQGPRPGRGPSACHSAHHPGARPSARSRKAAPSCTAGLRRPPPFLFFATRRPERRRTYRADLIQSLLDARSICPQSAEVPFTAQLDLEERKQRGEIPRPSTRRERRVFFHGSAVDEASSKLSPRDGRSRPGRLTALMLRSTN